MSPPSTGCAASGSRSGGPQDVELIDYARRKGWTLQEAERWLAPNLGYNPED
jgi:hypothetical protein